MTILCIIEAIGVDNGQKRTHFNEFVKCKRNISLTNEKAVVSFVLHAQIKEYPATVNLLDNKEMSDLKNRDEAELQRKIVAVIKKVQIHNVDPAGFGELYRGKLEEWNEEDFYRDTFQVPF